MNLPKIGEYWKFTYWNGEYTIHKITGVTDDKIYYDMVEHSNGIDIEDGTGHMDRDYDNMYSYEYLPHYGTPLHKAIKGTE
jgi:hypothetical protein